MSASIVDTFLNVTMFAYVGFLVWLVFRKT